MERNMGNIADLFLFDDDFANEENNYFTEKILNDKPVNIQGLGELSRVNIFIGSNNSGKSRFMRKLMNIKARGLNYEEHFKNVDYRQFINYVSHRKNGTLKTPEGLHPIIESFGEATPVLMECIGKYINSYFRRDVSEPATRNLAVLKQIFESRRNNLLYVYIPLLRSVNPFIFHEIKNNDLYGYYTQQNIEGLKDYSIKLNSGRRFIFTGQNIFEELKKKLLGNWDDRQQVREYEEFLSEKLFFNQKIVLIPKHNQKTISIKIGNQNERDLFKLGDGIQAIILLTFMMFIHKDNKIMFFIEEPEINLHPGLQRLLLQVMLDEDNKLGEQQYFFTTHSNHFLDMTLDYDNISVFNFQQIDEQELQQNNYDPKFRIKKTAPNDIELLNSLGVNNSSVFLSNCTIWVEGISDVIYLRAYLKKYLSKYPEDKCYQEDIHYSFVTYGGSCVEHWNFEDDTSEDPIFAKSLNSNIFLIADKDDGNEKKDNKLRGELMDNYYVTKSREVENIMHYKLLFSVISEHENRKLTQKINLYEKLIDIYQSDLENDTEGNSLFQDVILKEYLAIMIGHTDFDIYNSYKERSIQYYKIHKTKFAKIAKELINIMEYQDCMSKEAEEIASRIVQFIKTSNL